MFGKLTGILMLAACLVNFGNAKAKTSETESSETKDYSYCGQGSQRTRSRVRRVIGGQDATAHAWPWTVLIMNYTTVFCGASIISPTFLITAAHCVGRNRTNISLYAGKHRVDERDLHEQKLVVKKFYRHHKYRAGNDFHPGDYDMALIQLKNPIKFTEYVRPICLAGVDMFEPGHECVLSGWGYTNTTVRRTSNILQEIRLPLVSEKVCNSNKSYGGIIPQRYLCAGVPEGGKDGCFYDSGGPLMCAHSDTDPWYLVGMMIWGSGCAQKNKYGVYANVAKQMAMIKDKVKDLPRPYSPTGYPSPVQTSKKDSGDQNKEKIFIAIIAALCVIILILLTTLCIVHFYTRGYICCTATEKRSYRHNRAPRVLHEQNGKLNGEVSV
ncbi:transmembrane protease serine 9-like [Paramuricea clavata]|uniref:Transmembrane protease serine 9-like n=1 Tax=Paramuricea clavata TaxID=317549 RepID=A0A6S7FK96_PARCT|nr:transmembrane protease serine 9-like [Paramuricea clavata]